MNIVQVFLSLREQCSNNQDYGGKAFEVLKAFALNSNKNSDMFNVDSQNILNVFKVVVGSIEDKSDRCSFFGEQILLLVSTPTSLFPII